MKIHYFLEGDLGYDYRDSWIKYCPGCELVEWNSRNIPHIQELAPYSKSWSVLSDFVRRWAIFEFGGIYLDFDVELIKDIRPLFTIPPFVCIEGKPIYPNAAVTGGQKGNRFHEEMLDDYLDVLNGIISYPTRMELACSPWVLKDYVEKLKGSPLDETDLYEIKEHDGLITLPKEYFYPYNWNEEPGGITKNTVGIHYWKKGWDKL